MVVAWQLFCGKVYEISQQCCVSCYCTRVHAMVNTGCHFSRGERMAQVSCLLCRLSQKHSIKGARDFYCWYPHGTDLEQSLQRNPPGNCCGSQIERNSHCSRGPIAMNAASSLFKSAKVSGKRSISCLQFYRNFSCAWLFMFSLHSVSAPECKKPHSMLKVVGRLRFASVMIAWKRFKNSFILGNSPRKLNYSN